MTAQSEIVRRIADTLATAPIHDHLGYEALAYLKLPGPDYLKILRSLHLTLEPKLYVERGASIAQALDETRVIGIDPMPSMGVRPNTVIAVSTSDEFFKIEANREKCRGFDLAFIDGDHSHEQAHRDFWNLDKLAKPSSIICLHDTIPMDERTSQPKSDGVSFHTGDVWRLAADIVRNFPERICFTIACPPTGLTVIARLRAPIWPSTHMLLQAPVGFPFDDWEAQCRLLNIIPNTDDAIKGAFQQ
jgi:hypothetical protein